MLPKWGCASNACCCPSKVIKCSTLLLSAPPPPLLLLAIASFGGLVLHMWSSGENAPGPMPLPVPVCCAPTMSSSADSTTAAPTPAITRCADPNTAPGERGCRRDERCNRAGEGCAKVTSVLASPLILSYLRARA